jgi:hypothetical protein
MINFTDITAQCTIAAAKNNGNPYTDMKVAILQFTTKPKWSCYFDLHYAPHKGDIRTSLLMAKKLIGGSSTPTAAPAEASPAGVRSFYSGDPDMMMSEHASGVIT